MINNIKINDKEIYYEEIVHPEIFKKLYLIENIFCRFVSKVTTKTNRSFATFYSKDRKNKFKDNELLILRITKNNKQFQYISKLYKWGKFNVPNKIIKILDIKNHDKLKFEIISSSNHKNKLKGIDLSKIDRLNKICRNKNYVTLYFKQKTSITLPRYIEITTNLIELFFLIHGDGHYKEKLYFVNKNLGLVKFVIKTFLDKLKIPDDLWRYRININKRHDKEKSKTYWKCKLNPKEKQFYNSSETEFNTGKNGNLRIILDNTIISVVFRFIFKEIIRNLGKKGSFYALNGLLCAEGSPLMGKRGLHRISISFNHKEKGLFSYVLKKSNILELCKINDKFFIIEGWNNQYEFFKLFLSNDVIPFDNHNRRKEDLFRGFLEHSFTRTMKKYLFVLIKKDYFYVREVANLLNIRNDSVLSTLRKPQYNRFVKFKKSKNRFIVSLKKEGFYFVDLITKIERIEEEIMKNKLPFELRERKVIIKEKEETDNKFGKKPEDRTVEELIKYGIVVINKPQGPTSHQVSDYVQKILKIDKAGHGGSLEN